MFEKLDVFRMSSAMAIHAGQRQAVVAQNVANADTPGYKARDIPEFKAIYEPGDTGLVQRASRNRHLHGGIDASPALSPFETRDEASPDGNTVSVETEMARGVEAKRQHDRALAIYKSALTVLRTTIGK